MCKADALLMEAVEVDGKFIDRIALIMTFFVLLCEWVETDCTRSLNLLFC